jgi:hypothetical protein
MLSVFRSLKLDLAVFVVVAIAAVALFAASYDWRGPDTSQPDPNLELQFGRGSGLSGLDLLRVVSDGTASFEFQTEEGDWRRKRFHLDANAMADLRAEIDKLRIMELAPKYQADLCDGTQWCLLLRIDGKTKFVYFNNSFPDEIRKLSDYVDNVILGQFAEPVPSRAVLPWQHRQHEETLWASIR